MLADSNWFVCGDAHKNEDGPLARIKELLPDQPNIYGWTNVNFLDDRGNVHEVDLILLCPQGWFLIELKAWRGFITGNDSMWQFNEQNKTGSEANPLPLANRKAKLLKGKLAQKNKLLTYLRCEAYLILTQREAKLGLDTSNAARVRLLDPRPTFLNLLDGEPQLKASDIDGIVKTMALCGLDKKPTEDPRRFGEYTLFQSLNEGNGWQEWVAQQEGRALQRLRIYRREASPDPANMQRIARKAFTVLERIDHPGFLRPTHFFENAKGVALAYDHYPGETRMDTFVVERHSHLPLRDRLRLFIALTETLAYAHGKGIYHRSLSPSKVWLIDPDKPSIRPKITDWALSKKDNNDPTFQSQLNTTLLHSFFEEEALLYQAPEWRSASPDPAKLDLFSLGALGFTLFTGLKPAETPESLEKRLTDQLGLNPALSAPGIPPDLDELIFNLTYYYPFSRCSLSHTLATLSQVYAALPEPGFSQDPEQAQPGELLLKDVKVLARLGQGASAIVYLVETGKRQLVLKMAYPKTNNERIQQEGRVLEELRDKHVVACKGQLPIQGHAAILLDYADHGTLAEYLAQHVRLKPELLKRFGQQLLETLAYLESVGVAHRDLKPENLGLTRSDKDMLNLLLFDFSLVGTAVEALHVGTAPYRDPFLGHHGRFTWDLHADRYSAALVLHKCATGRLPSAVGGSQPNPKNPIEVVPEHFAQLPSLVAFFQRALAVQTADRFQDLNSMLETWTGLFENLPAQTPLSDFSFSEAAKTAFKQLNISTRDELLDLTPQALHRQDIPKEVRRELERTRSLWQKLEQNTQQSGVCLGLDKLWENLSKFAEVKDLLGDPAAPGTTFSPHDLAQYWPDERKLLETLAPEAKSAKARSFQQMRDRWSRDKNITQLRTDIAGYLEKLGHVTSLPQLLDHLLYNRGSAKSDSERQLVALAVLRAADETEKCTTQPRWIHARVGSTLVFACHGKELLGYNLAESALKLGVVADEIVALSTLQASGQALKLLRKVDFPAGLEPPDANLLDLACACSRNALRSSANELYPRDLSPQQAFDYVRPNVYHKVTELDLRKRVEGRFPGVRLPSEVYTFLQENGFPRVKVLETGSDGAVFDLEPSALSALSSLHSNHPERVSQLSAAAFDKRLAHERDGRGFLVLTCANTEHANTLAALKRRAVTALDGDVLVLDALRAHAQRKGIPWQVVLEADARSDFDWETLCAEVAQIVPELERALSGHEQPVLLYHLGLFVRYGLVALLEQLGQRCGRRDGLAGLWVLIPEGQSDLSPKLDNCLIPVFSPNQWARVPESWLHHAAHPEEPA